VATARDVSAIALSLPGVTGSLEPRLAFSVTVKGKPKGLAWSWLERVHPRKARVPNNEVLAVRVRDQGEKAILLAADTEKFFTEPHYNGYPAVLVRLRAVTKAELRALLVEAWRCLAPPELQEAGAPTRRAPAPPRTRRRKA
jgi:hypothetical protein